MYLGWYWRLREITSRWNLERNIWTYLFFSILTISEISRISGKQIYAYAYVLLARQLRDVRNCWTQENLTFLNCLIFFVLGQYLRLLRKITPKWKIDRKIWKYLIVSTLAISEIPRISGKQIIGICICVACLAASRSQKQHQNRTRTTSTTIHSENVKSYKNRQIQNITSDFSDMLADFSGS